MIVLLFKAILFTSIWVLGLTIVTQKKMALWVLRDITTNNDMEATRKIYDPLIVCHWCMPSIHSIVGFLAAWGLGIITVWSWKYLILYPFVVMGSSIVCGLTWAVYKAIEAATLYFTNGQKVFYQTIQKNKNNHNTDGN